MGGLRFPPESVALSQARKSRTRRRRSDTPRAATRARSPPDGGSRRARETGPRRRGGRCPPWLWARPTPLRRGRRSAHGRSGHAPARTAPDRVCLRTGRRRSRSRRGVTGRGAEAEGERGKAEGAPESFPRLHRRVEGAALGLERGHHRRQPASAKDPESGGRGARLHGYWMIWSARAMTERGIFRPRALAAFALITSSNLVACSTGMSAGLAPFRILSMKMPARRQMSGKFTA